MNRYPLWKYILVALALTVGLFYTLPNFFGEVPAVQISPAKSTAKVDETLLSRVDQTLTEASIRPDGIFLDPASIKVRLANTDLQLKAKDVLQSKLGEKLRRGAELVVEFATLACEDQRAADVPRTGLARWRALSASGRHERRPDQGGGSLRRRYTDYFARQGNSIRGHLA
jgi:hypothetical protein